MKNQSARQSFLGKDSDEIFRRAKIGFIGLGGGGSHLVQQYAHLGLGNFVLVDDDRIEDTNLNRLIGGTVEDVKHSVLKSEIAQRVIKGVNPEANVIICNAKWQEISKQLRDCDIIHGNIDSFAGRRDLELYTRRFLIPYIDIGMDVHKVNNHYAISGQVILSLPGHICMHCMKYLREQLLEQEAARYGMAGDKPQVVWPNGVLASIAVGLGVQLLTPWAKMYEGSVYLEYDGNTGVIVESPRMKYLKGITCNHFYDVEGMGDPFYKTQTINS